MNDSDEKYKINNDFDALNSCSTTDLTGLIPSAPESEEELESYNDVYTFRAKSIVAKDIEAKGKVENQNQTHNVKKEGITPINQKR